MNLTEEEKLRLKILKIKMRKLLHRCIKTSVKIIKKVGLVVGFTLVSICGKAQTSTSFKNILAAAMNDQKNGKELVVMLENQAKKDSLANNIIQDEINNQINVLAKEFLQARTDSLSSSIDRLKNSRTRSQEIRRNFKDAIGVPQISSHCLATQCAADYRALKAMGLGEIIPQSLKESSALCRSYVRTDEVKPFAHEVANTDTAIREFIRNNKMSGGTLVFYPRDRYNYHAVSIDMPEKGFEYDDSTYQILTSSANKERKSVPVSTASFRAKAPGRKAIIVDKLEFFIALLEKHLEGKSLAEQTALLYQGGADEFIQHISKATNIDKKQMVASIENIVTESNLSMSHDKRQRNGLYMLALVPLAYNRRSDRNMYLLDIVEDELNKFSSLEDKCAYLDKTLGKALVGMSKEEQRQFVESLVFSSRDNYKKMDQTVATLAAYNFWKIINKASSIGKEDIWHKVASSENKAPVQKDAKKSKDIKIKSSKQRS